MNDMPRSTGELDLTGRTVVVTGAGHGMGRAIARRSARFGADVVMADVHEENLREAEAEVREDGAREVRALVLDVAAPASIEAMVDAAGEIRPSVHALVNSAGVVRFGPLKEQTSADWHHVHDVNLHAPYELSMAFLPALREAGGGAVVNISSLAAIQAFTTGGAYGSSKAALVALTKQLAGEWGRYGVRVNAICPGLIGTGFGAAERREPSFVEHRASAIPLRREGAAEEIASVAHFFMSELSSYVTGTALVVDGAHRHAYVRNHLTMTWDFAEDDD